MGVDRLKTFLQKTEPPHDYGKLILLWTAVRYPDLISAEKKKTLVEMVKQQQLPDGGWSIRTFATPEAWGRGNRAEKLRAEPEYDQMAQVAGKTCRVMAIRPGWRYLSCVKVVCLPMIHRFKKGWNGY